MHIFCCAMGLRKKTTVCKLKTNFHSDLSPEVDNNLNWRSQFCRMFVKLNRKLEVLGELLHDEVSENPLRVVCGCYSLLYAWKSFSLLNVWTDANCICNFSFNSIEFGFLVIILMAFCSSYYLLVGMLTENRSELMAWIAMQSLIIVSQIVGLIVWRIWCANIFFWIGVQIGFWKCVYSYYKSLRRLEQKANLAQMGMSWQKLYDSRRKLFF